MATIQGGRKNLFDVSSSNRGAFWQRPGLSLFINPISSTDLQKNTNTSNEEDISTSSHPNPKHPSDDSTSSSSEDEAETAEMKQQGFADVDGASDSSSSSKQQQGDADLKGLTCLTCGIVFESVEMQHAHFKTDWHLFNLQRRRVKQEAVDEQTFRQIIDEASDAETVGDEEDEDEEGDKEVVGEKEGSGRMRIRLAEEEEEEEETEAVGFGSPRVRVLDPENKRLIVVWRCVLPVVDMGEDSTKEQRMMEAVRNLHRSKTWAYFMCSGGYFAGAIYDGKQCLCHKVFRRYTVRRKQGGSQSSRDSKGNKPRSAGAYMRRYHETQLRKEIREQLAAWKETIARCDVILCYLPGGGANRKIFFYEGSPLGYTGRGKGMDRRVRSIPFYVQRPALSEIERVHSVLSVVDFEDIPVQPSNGEQRVPFSESEGEVSNHSEHSEDELRSSRDPVQRTQDEEKQEDEILDAVKRGDTQELDRVLSKSELEDSPLLRGEGYRGDTPLAVACAQDDAEMVQFLLKKGHNVNAQVASFNYWPVLHKASALGNSRMVGLLLTHGADPTVKGELVVKTAYDLATNKETRNAFRRFAGKNLERWNWNEAKVPPLTKDMASEAKQKEKEKRRKKKAAQKKKKQEDKVKAVEEEKERRRREVEEKEEEEGRKRREEKVRERVERQKQKLKGRKLGSKTKAGNAEASAMATATTMAANAQPVNVPTQAYEETEAELQRAIELSLLESQSHAQRNSQRATAPAPSAAIPADVDDPEAELQRAIELSLAGSKAPHSQASAAAKPQPQQQQQQQTKPTASSSTTSSSSSSSSTTTTSSKPESQMSEREKRAIAAEKRQQELAKAQGEAKKCDCCGEAVTGAPFTRLTFSYCSTKCVRQHKDKLGR